jgi:hypothetical protein
MAFPVLAGIALGVSAARNIAGAGDRRAAGRNIRAVEDLAPRIRDAGLEATGASREAVERFREFDALGGFDEELAARIRAPLESARARGNAAGRFRSGRQAQTETEIIGREAAGLLTARQRLQLEGAAGLSNAAGNLGRQSLDFIGAQSELHSGLAEFFEGRGARRNQELFSAFNTFLTQQGAAGAGG